jgi:hypothetical protein
VKTSEEEEDRKIRQKNDARAPSKTCNIIMTTNSKPIQSLEERKATIMLEQGD